MEFHTSASISASGPRSAFSSGAAAAAAATGGLSILGEVGCGDTIVLELLVLVLLLLLQTLLRARVVDFVNVWAIPDRLD